MTKQEHELMIILFAKQLQCIKIILGILKSRGIVEHDDPQAFASLELADAESSAALLQDAQGQYLALAKRLGITLDLETP